MDNTEPLVLDRERLSLGKFTRWATNLSHKAIYVLLWLVGESSIRTSKHNLRDSIQEIGRARTGLLGVLGFVHGCPLSLEQPK
jgi:hypothetical protein